MIGKYFIVLCASLFAFVANTEARSTTIQKTDSGLLSAMHRLGCSGEWLSVVMADSHISELRLTKLAVGTKVVTLASCKGHPSKVARAKSVSVLARQNRTLTITVLRQENVKLKSELQTAKDSASKNTPAPLSRYEVGETLRVVLRQELAKLSQEGNAPEAKYIMIFVGSGILFTLVVLFAVYFFYFRRRHIVLSREEYANINREKYIVPIGHILVPRVATVTSGSKEFLFELLKLRRKCADCGDEVDDDNKERHVRKAHTHSSVDTKTTVGI